jgi:NitT/TauT family transport system substrate-binding protein
MKIVTDFTHRPVERVDYAFTKEDYYRDPDCIPNLKYLQDAIDLAVKNGVLKKSIDVDKYADISVVKEAAKRVKK